MDVDRKNIVYHSQSNRSIYFNRHHVLLVAALVGVQIFFIMQCCGVMSPTCHTIERPILIPLNETNEEQEEDHIEMIVTEIRAQSDHPQQASVSHTTTGYTSSSPNTTPASHTTTKTREKTEKVENIHERQLKRQLQLRQFCRDKGHPPEFNLKTNRKAYSLMYKMSNNFLYSDLQGIIYAYVPKAACTNWKRMLQVFDGNILHPLEISDKRLVHRLKYSHLNRLPRNEREWRRNSYYSFTFVRDPLERLLSVYRNKFLDPYTPSFQKRYGSQILKLFRTNLTEQEYKAGKDISFKEFIEYLIITYDTKGFKHFDEHWQIMNKLCQPCTIKYNYIGKMETLLEDANQVLKEINLFDKVKFPANATDKYKLEVRTLMKKYYGTLTKKSIKRLYEIYEQDFLAFGYKVPDYL